MENKANDQENDDNKQEKNDNINLQDDDTFNNFMKKAYQNISAATNISNCFPQEQSWDLHAANPNFMKVMCKLEQLTVNLMSRVLKHQQVKGNIQERDADEKYDMILEANDILTDKISNDLDELSGVKKKSTPIFVESSINSNDAAKAFSSPGTGSWNKNILNGPHPNKIRLLTAHNIQRPQVLFKDKIDNSSCTPFIPKILDKPNSRKPLALEATEDGFTHPYDFELENFVPFEDQLTIVEPIKPLDIDKTPLIRVDDENSLKSLLRDLMSEKLFALDLEHHSYRSFQGITCLMQISTRKCDYIIDTLALRDKLHILNEVFTRPDIVKILHGADHDIEWLQRDLGLYLVNMFDSHQAAKQLEFPRLSLAFLLKHYCAVDANKHFQLADWRIRPLPEELLLYARQDTHYLPYIYDKMRNELIDKGNGKSNILESVISKSTNICKKIYIKPKLTNDSHLEFYIKSKRMFDNRQLYALREIYNWRDTLAREEDESTGYVLPNHMLLQICETLPREMQGILACCNPIPPLVRQNLMFLHQIILRAREQSLVKPILKEEIRTRGPEQKSGAINLEGPLHCPHDLSQQLEFRDDLPTLLGDLDNINMDKCFAHNVFAHQEASLIAKKMILYKPSISVFDSPEHSENEEENSSILLKLRKTAFISPYERYKLVRPFVESIERDSNNVDDKTLSTNDSNNVILSDKDRESMIRVKQHFEALTKNTPEINEVKSTPTTSTSKAVTSTNETLDSEKLDPQIPLNMQRKRKREDTEEQSSSKDSRNTNKQNSKRIKFQKRRHNQNESGDSNFKPYDYDSVDYTKFHGGSQQLPRTDQVKSKFTAKGKNKFNGYRNNKSYTFGKNKNSRKK